MQCHTNIRARAREHAHRKHLNSFSVNRSHPLSSSIPSMLNASKALKPASRAGVAEGGGCEKRQGELRTADKKNKKQLAFPLAPTDSEPSDRTTLPVIYFAVAKPELHTAAAAAAAASASSSVRVFGTLARRKKGKAPPLPLSPPVPRRVGRLV